MKIRPATKADIPVMAELLHELFAIEADFTPDYALQVQGLEQLVESDSAMVLVAQIGAEVVGMCTVQILISTAAGGRVGYVEDVVVDIKHREKGVGTAMLRALETRAADHKLARLQLLADRDNHTAIRFYRCRGWQPTSLCSWMKHDFSG